jgi:hypothetical protein
MQYIDGNQRPPIIEMLRTAVRKPDDQRLKAKIDQHLTSDVSVLDIKPANEWLAQEKHKPAPQKLFGDFWLQGELCILFADTNIGKSILAVQLADSISKQQHINGFELEAKACPVLYVDFELSSKQFEARYSDSRGSYPFAAEFYRAEVDLQAQQPPGYKDFIHYMSYILHRAIKSTGARVLVIDNITCLGGSSEQSSRALAMMQQLKALKTRHGLSILVLAHTPKRGVGKAIGRNDLGGSKMLINFADSAIAMAPSCTMPGHCYIKQVKQRGAAETYGADKVCLFKREKLGSFLCFTFITQSAEHEHLLSADKQDRERLIGQVASLQSQGFNQREISAQLRLSLGLVNKLVQEGKV